MKTGIALLCLLGAWTANSLAQSADGQSVIWRGPQVRYLLADMTLGGKTKLYRDHATTERDPDSREAIRLWDAGARVVNTNDFEPRWVTNQFGQEGGDVTVFVMDHDGANKRQVVKEMIDSEKPADERPGWVLRSDGSEATLIEPLRFQMAIDGSRARRKPLSQ